MSREVEDKPGIIPIASRNPELEIEVDLHVRRVMAMNPFRVEKKYTHIEIPDFKKTEWREQINWEMEEIRRCIEGYDGMSGRYYYYLNHARIKHKKRGMIRPDFRATQMWQFNKRDEIYKTPGRGIVEIKRRQYGESWAMAADNIYDCQFHREFDIGMNSKSDQDSQNLFLKHKYVHRNQSPFLRGFVHIDKRDAMTFGRWIEKEKRWKGTLSSIISVAPTPTAHAGNQYKKLVIDEAGEQCWGFGTKIKMFDGSNKEVQNIAVGDEVMGKNSEKLIVTQLCNGEDDLYEVIPNKGEPFICNSKHLLSLKFNGRDKIQNISAEEFFKLPSPKQKYFQLFRVGVEYEKSDYFFNPYWFGLWLGDGDKDGPCVVSNDFEIQEYLYNIAPIEHNCFVSKYKNTGDNLYSYNLHNKRKTHNGVLSELKKLGVFKNKHIPDCYLKTTREDRLKLLAGIIDSDGHKDNRKNRYEITLSLKRLAKDVQELCLSLGFSATFHEKKVCKLKKDGTYLNTIHYRVGIHGNTLHEIPNKLPRKKVTTIFGKTRGRKDPQKSGFTIHKVGRGNYYGFSLDKSPYFLLKDYTVVHNCDLIAMWSNAEDCIMQETERVGCPIIFGTVGEMTKGGRGILEFWKNAHIYNLEQMAIWGYNCLLIDEFGNDDIENSIRWIIYERKKREAGATRTYSKFIQKYPLNEFDAFLDATGGGVGDPLLLGKQRIYLFDNPPMKFTGFMRPSVVDNRTSDFVPDELHGKIIMYERPDPGRSNGYIITCDPAEDDDVEKTKDTSNLSTSVLAKPFGLEPPKLVLEYVDRPKKLHEYYYQLAMILQVYNNSRLHIELNKGGWRMLDWFELHFPHLLAFTPNSPNSVKGGMKMTRGLKMTPERKMQLKGLGDGYVENYHNFIPSIRLIDELGVFGIKGKDDDLATAFLWGLAVLQGEKIPVGTAGADSVKTPKVDYKNIGGRIQLVGPTGEPVQSVQKIARPKSALFRGM